MSLYALAVSLAVLVSTGRAATPSQLSAAEPSTQPAAPERVTRTRAEVEALIAQAGRTQPEWWDTVELRYPPTLDLTWANADDKSLGWAPDRKLGAFLWSRIGSNPGRFREGVKLLHHCLTVNKDNKAALIRTMGALAWSYYEFLEDYPRAVFWWQMEAKMAGVPMRQTVALARSYYRMGNQAMALEILNRYSRDTTAGSAVIRLWAEMGATQRALAMAQAQVQSGLADAGYLVMGDIHRQAGNLKLALACYRKALEAAAQREHSEKNRKRAQVNIDNIQLLEALDLTRVPDGTYKGSALGYIGDIEVAVTVKAGRIESIDIVQTREDRPLTALQEMPARILSKQAIKGVDVVSGATVTSDAIIYATGKALQQGMGKGAKSDASGGMK